MPKPRLSDPEPGSGVTVHIPQPSPVQDRPSAEKDTATFWEILHTIQTSEWATEGNKGYKVYLYRDHPKPATKGSGYKRLITEPFDIEWVRQELGGYDYRALLNDPSGRLVSSVSFSIDAPPKDVGEITAPATPAGNDFQAQVLRVIETNAQETREMLRDLVRSRQDSAGAGDRVTMDHPIVIKGILDIVNQMMPKPPDVLSQLTQLKNLITPATPTPSLLEILKQAKELGLMPGAIAGAAGSGNLLGQLDDLLAVADKLGAVRGGKDPSIMHILAEKAPEIVERVSSMFDKWSRVAEQQRIAAQYRYQTAEALRTSNTIPGSTLPSRGVTMTAPAPSPGPQAGTLDVVPLTPQTFAPATTETADATSQAGANAEVYQVDEIDFLKRRVVHGIASGHTGADIVSFISMINAELVDTFVGVSAEDLETFFGTDPILQEAARYPRFKAVMLEIVDELKDEDKPAPAESLVN